MRATMRGVAERIPDARFVEIPEAGYIPGIERPAAFNDAVTALTA